MNQLQKVGVIFSILTIFGFTSDARAGKMMFGTDESIRTIEQTKDPEYNLCYKTSIYFFVAGCYVKDDGYVLQKVGESKSYMTLTPELKEQLQSSGILPNPLPPYSLSFFDYLFGYSNWIILAVVIGIPAFNGLVAKLRGTSDQTADAVPVTDATAVPAPPPETA